MGTSPQVVAPSWHKPQAPPAPSPPTQVHSMSGHSWWCIQYYTFTVPLSSLQLYRSGRGVVYCLPNLTYHQLAICCLHRCRPRFPIQRHHTEVPRIPTKRDNKPVLIQHRWEIPWSRTTLIKLRRHNTKLYQFPLCSTPLRNVSSFYISIFVYLFLLKWSAVTKVDQIMSTPGIGQYKADQHKGGIFSADDWQCTGYVLFSYCIIFITKWF